MIDAPLQWTDIGIFAVLAAQLGLLAVAAWFGWRQLRAQVRPFIAVDLEPSVPFMQLVITNLGATMARDVSFKFTPSLESTLPGKLGHPPLSEVSLFKDGIASFPPGKRIVVLLEDERDRAAAKLPDRYEVVVSYSGEPFRPRRFVDPPIVLDIATYLGWSKINRKDVHDVAQELEKLRTAIENRST